MSTQPHSLVLLARDALTRGDLAAASQAAEQRLVIEPGDADALELRYLLQYRRGEIAKATETLQSIITTDPQADWARNDLIRLLFQHGNRPESEQVARAALRANPRNSEAHNLFGTILSELNDLPSGEWHFRRALELAGPHAEFLANLALNLMQQGRTEDAELCFAKADALEPGNMKTLAHWSKLCEVCGDLKRAEQLLDRAQAASSAKDVDLLRANYLARAGRREAALAILNAEPQLGGHAQLERGRLHDQQARYEEAWRDFVEGKSKLAREAGGLHYQAQAVDAFFSRLKKFFTRAHIDLLPRATLRSDTPQPIFIVGLPRSGTTMIEQVLSSHSRLRAGGELAYIADLRKLANLLFPGPELFPDNLAQSWTADQRHAAALFRDYYLARAEQSGLTLKGKSHFTDKMPFNELYLPVLKMAFPHAKIIRVVRHPLDVCVSMLANNLTHGFNCGYQIESIVHHIAAVSELVEHYVHELALNDVVLKYESFIADQSAQTRRLLAYVELPFEEACLRFHENRRYAPTPSYAQVTEPLNDRSINRHRHYARQLEPFLPALKPMLTRYGYD